MKPLFLTGLWIFSCIHLSAEVPWWNHAWQYRAEIVIETPRLSTAIDAASVNLFTDGKARPGAEDIRIIDVTGKEIPFHILSTGDKRLQILFYVEGKKREKFYAYFGNRSAEKPSYSWVPQTGELVLETRKKTDRHHPANLKQMLRGFNSSSTVYNKGNRKKIDDSENPFGPNDYYYSYYRGHINCPVEGEYWFATNSDDASFLLIDGKLVTGWPMSHTKDGGVNKPLVNIWSKRNRLRLNAGVHLIEYYQEEGVGSQMARAGWKRPGDEDFEIIPEESFVSSLNAAQNSFEEKGSPPSVFFNYVPVRKIQFAGIEGEFATLKFINKTSLTERGKIEYHWNFGDGTYSDKKEPEHTFVADREYNITLTARWTDRKETKRTTIPVKIETDTIKTERFSVNMGVVSDKMVYDEREEADITCWVRNYTEKSVNLSLSREIFNRSGERLSSQTEAINLESYRFREITFSTSPDISEIHIFLKYNGHTVKRKDIVFMEPVKKIFALDISEGRIENQQGKQILLRIKKRPEKITYPAGTKRDTSRVVLVSSYGQNPPDGRTYSEQFLNMIKNRSNGGFEIKHVNIETSLPYYSPLLSLIKMDEILSHNPGLVLFIPGQNEINYMLDIDNKFKNLLSSFINLLHSNNVQCMLIVPPAVEGKVEQSTSLAVAIKEVGMRYSIPLLDLYSLLPPERQKIEIRYRLTDNVFSSFPDAATRRFLAERLSEYIRKWISHR